MANTYTIQSCRCENIYRNCTHDAGVAAQAISDVLFAVWPSQCQCYMRSYHLCLDCFHMHTEQIFSTSQVAPALCLLLSPGSMASQKIHDWNIWQRTPHLPLNAQSTLLHAEEAEENLGVRYGPVTYSVGDVRIHLLNSSQRQQRTMTSRRKRHKAHSLASLVS